MKPAKKCRDAWQDMQTQVADGPLRNFTQSLDMSDFVVETDLFPIAVLDAYSAWNSERPVTDEMKRHINPERGGNQGDYRDGMRQKIANVVDCLTKFPQSKRAVISVCNDPAPHHSDDANAKCVRELHFYIDTNERLSGTMLLRAQAVTLFPKNIHMVGTIMTQIAAQLPYRPSLGTIFYLTTVLVSDRA